MRTSASPMRFLTLAMPSSNNPPGATSTIPVARLSGRPVVSWEKWSVALMASVGRGWRVGRRLERPLDAADDENAVDRLRAHDADDAALLSTRTSRADELVQPCGVHEVQP